MPRPNPFRTKRQQYSDDAFTTTQTSHHAFEAPFEGAYAANGSLEQPVPVRSSTQRRTQKIVRIASPPVSAEREAAGHGDGLPTPTASPPVLEAAEASPFEGEALFVQQDPAAPFQTLTPRPGSPPPVSFGISKSRQPSTEEAHGEGPAHEAAGKENEAGPVQPRDPWAQAGASTGRESQRSPPSSTSQDLQRGPPQISLPVRQKTAADRGNRQSMDVDAFKHMLMTGNPSEAKTEKSTEKKPGMNVDEFTKMLLGGRSDDSAKDQASISTTEVHVSDTQVLPDNGQQTGVEAQSRPPSVPLPRRAPSTRRNITVSEASSSITTSSPSQKPPPPPPRTRHGKTLSVTDQITDSDGTRRRSSASVRSTSSSLTQPLPAPPPPPPRHTRADDTESNTDAVVDHTSGHHLDPSNVDEDSSRRPSSANVSISSVESKETMQPASETSSLSSVMQRQSLRRPPTPPLARRASQIRRTGSNRSVPRVPSGPQRRVSSNGPSPPSSRGAPPPPPARDSSSSSLTGLGLTIPEFDAAAPTESRKSSVEVAPEYLSTESEDSGTDEVSPLPAISSKTEPPMDSLPQPSESPGHEPPQPSLPAPLQPPASSKRQSLPPPRPPPRRAHNPSGSRLSLEDTSRDSPGSSRPTSSESRHRRVTSSGSASGPPPPPPRPHTTAADADGAKEEEINTFAPPHAAEVLADLTKLQQEIDAYRKQASTEENK